MAAMCLYMENEKLNSEQRDELFDVFSNSLLRTGENDSMKFTLKKSPSFKELVRYEGIKTVEQFHDDISLDLQRFLFTQRVEKEPEEEKPAHRCGIMYYAKIPLESPGGFTTGPLDKFPRGAIQTIEYLKGESKKPKIIYFGPKGMFGIGDPKDWNNSDLLNLKASSLFGGEIRLFGDVTVYRKKPIPNEIEPIKRKRKKGGGP